MRHDPGWWLMRSTRGKRELDWTREESATYVDRLIFCTVVTLLATLTGLIVFVMWLVQR